MSKDISECRICFDIETNDDKFISPCRCKGTSKYVHKSCLNSWRNFNRESIAWTTCMECGTKYKIKYKYPIEKKKIFKGCCNNVTGNYLLKYSVCLVVSGFIWNVDYHNDYLAVKMLNFFQPSTSYDLLYYVKQNDLCPQLFYFSYTMFLQSIIYHLYFVAKCYYNVKRKSYYIYKIKDTFCGSLIFSTQFLVLYYIFAFNGFVLLYLNLITFLSMVEPIGYYKLIKKHNKIIIEMNENNIEEILPYHNIIDNIIDNNNNMLELENIIID
tara:strand:+ start:670 stop:1479 length:810 start_codon:yes stop_codon:yes gene_type:complete